MKVTRFEDLEIWKESMSVVHTIYKITSALNFSRDFSLKEQIRRSSISVPSNISEGFERSNNVEFKRFLIIAKGSAGELRTQLRIAFSLNYLSQKQFDEINSQLMNLSGKIANLIKYLIKTKHF